MSVFEGMKAFADAESPHVVRLFRPHFHAQRLNASAERMALPTFDEEELIRGVFRLVLKEQALGWIPTGRGAALYIRPLIFASEGVIGVRRSNEAMLVVTCHPVGSYFRSGVAKPLRLFADTEHVRAFRGGVGFAKTAGNYACSMQPAEEATRKGYDQILWTDGTPEHMVGECGQMNFFWVERGAATSRLVLVTPALDGTILPGATRDSVLVLAPQLGLVHDVEERHVPLRTLTSAIQGGTVVEMFCTGTGASVVPVRSIAVAGEEFVVRDSGAVGDMSSKLREALHDIQHSEHAWTATVGDETAISRGVQ
jgi:branched-chain amino acid aminotransferase